MGGASGSFVVSTQNPSAALTTFSEAPIGTAAAAAATTAT
eukprot:CAMPEP_0171736820 /NCGR_PEP_ID=MMETSP0991-20121206/32510_1 /TAXON_ID=483369 /ORGANISM="non described non described, Strain CCMP2098" /LENGTH=39 /DNA_ID= /DNA_START= /DNA_END= /DNA_ORIENTATION=